MKDRLTKVSKFLSLVLRHKPDDIGIQLDEAGWVSIDDLLTACGRHRFSISRDELENVVRANDKQRFAISDDGLRIRANQGHSVKVELGNEPAEPPEILFHGTVERFIPAIRREGLKKGKRHDVHLSANETTATKVGERRGEAIILKIASHKMYEAGYVFYRSANNVWLTDHVPPEFIL